MLYTYILRPNYKEKKREKERKTKTNEQRLWEKKPNGAKDRRRKARKESRDMTGLRKCASQPERKKSERKKELKERKTIFV